MADMLSKEIVGGFEILIRQISDGEFTATVPAMPGVIGVANSREGIRKEMAALIESHLKDGFVRNMEMIVRRGNGSAPAPDAEQKRPRKARN